jgi:hypothetical protein
MTLSRVGLCRLTAADFLQIFERPKSCKKMRACGWLTDGTAIPSFPRLRSGTTTDIANRPYCRANERNESISFPRERRHQSGLPLYFVRLVRQSSPQVARNFTVHTIMNFCLLMSLSSSLRQFQRPVEIALCFLIYRNALLHILVPSMQSLQFYGNTIRMDADSSRPSQISGIGISLPFLSG